MPPPEAPSVGQALAVLDMLRKTISGQWVADDEETAYRVAELRAFIEAAERWEHAAEHWHDEAANMRPFAERYRWLRNTATLQQARTIVNDTAFGMDAAIDAARATQTAGKGD